MKPFIVLATYRPKKWRASIVGRDLTDLTHELGLIPHYDPAHGPLELTGRNWASKVLHAEVRRRSFKTKMAESYHYDGDTTSGSRPDCALVLWASNTPTLVKWQAHTNESSDTHDDKIYQARPYEIIIFHNMHCLHRRPENAPRVRWIFRQRVSLPDPKILRLP